jgi:hypothetical protein
VTQAIRVRPDVGYRNGRSAFMSTVVGNLTVIIIGYSASRHVNEVLRGD